jgi:hypothetical protein
MKRKSFLLSIGIVLLLVLTTVEAQARCWGRHGPAFLPLAVAGAVVGTVAAVTTAFVPAPPCAYAPCPGPGYYAPAPVYYHPGLYHPRPGRFPGHHYRYGYRGPGHW